ncbi:MAG: NUDIX domain-containing protein [Anaerolineae bacterium]|nr:NUDIX domain-containing protein [Anaerolineae bacterium]
MTRRAASDHDAASGADYVAWIRRRVGRQRLLLVYATAVVFDDAGNVLVQRRADFDWPGLPGGVLEPDEDLAGCARREVREETGLHVRLDRLVGIYSDPAYNLAYPNGDLVQPWTVCFAGHAAGGELRADGSEITGVRFEAPGVALSRLPPHYRHMLGDALAAARTPPSSARCAPPPARRGTLRRSGSTSAQRA